MGLQTGYWHQGRWKASMRIRSDVRGNRWHRPCWSLVDLSVGSTGTGTRTRLFGFNGLRVRPRGFEPPTSGSGDQRSIQAELQAPSDLSLVSYFMARLQPSYPWVAATVLQLLLLTWRAGPNPIPALHRVSQFCFLRMRTWKVIRRLSPGSLR